MLLVTGSAGQLGSELKRLISCENAIFTTKDILDITEATKVQEFVKSNDVDFIINCAAYTAVDKAEDNIETAFSINAIGAENLAKTGCGIIHISTDYVFDGTGNQPYKTTDKTNPISVYGKSKLAGEIAVLNNAETAVIIRTSWVYSEYGNNFLKTIRRLGHERQKINVVYDQLGTPTYAHDLAYAITQIIPQMSVNNKGIYHFTNNGVCSWYDFAIVIKELSGLQCEINPVLSKEYMTMAVRPCYSVLDKAMIQSAFDIKIQHWIKGVEECLKRF